MAHDPHKHPKERGPSLHLDILEEGFGKLYKRRQKSKRGAKHQTGGAFPEAAAHFKDHEVALGAVASTFAKRRTALRPAEFAGGNLAAVLLLPRSVSLGPDPAANRDLFFTRAAIAGAMAACDSAPSASDDEAAVLSAGVHVACVLAETFEGFRERARAAASLELGSRPPLADLPDHERPLEVLRHCALETLIAGEDQLPDPRTFKTALERFHSLERAALVAPERSFFTRLMRSAAPVQIGADALLLFGGPLTPTDRDEAAALVAELESAEAAAKAVEHEAPVRDHVTTTTLEEDPYKENMPSHSFEKIDFADKYEGGIRKLDGADDMEEQAESLDGVDLREMIRGGPEVQTIYKAEIGDTGRIPDVETTLPGERGITYDEWDQATCRYRRDWVTLYPTQLTESFAEFGSELCRDLRATSRRAIAALEARRTERVLRTRQLDGDEIDLDGLIEEYAERKRGGNPPGRHYIRAPRLERDTATLVLLDVSLSADSWIENRRVLDVELAAACVLGEVAENFDEPLSILAFASNTRNLCRTWTVKGWKDSWAKGRARLGALKPQGYTRIGPAIRHATAQLTAHPARKKHLILVTDGKPTDFDRYEGGHGVHDVAWAVREARRSEVSVHALGIDPRAATLLPTMFGPGGWRVLRHITDLPEALVKAYD